MVEGENVQLIMRKFSFWHNVLNSHLLYIPLGVFACGKGGNLNRRRNRKLPAFQLFLQIVHLWINVYFTVIYRPLFHLLMLYITIRLMGSTTRKISFLKVTTNAITWSQMSTHLVSKPQDVICWLFTLVATENVLAQSCKHLVQIVPMFIDNWGLRKYLIWKKYIFLYTFLLFVSDFLLNTLPFWLLWDWNLNEEIACNVSRFAC